MDSTAEGGSSNPETTPRTLWRDAQKSRLDSGLRYSQPCPFRGPSPAYCPMPSPLPRRYLTGNAPVMSRSTSDSRSEVLLRITGALPVRSRCGHSGISAGAGPSMPPFLEHPEILSSRWSAGGRRRGSGRLLRQPGWPPAGAHGQPLRNPRQRQGTFCFSIPSSRHIMAHESWRRHLHKSQPFPLSLAGSALNFQVHHQLPNK